MKTTRKMKMIIFLITAFIMIKGYAQETYLKFTNVAEKTSISYAPNTKFEVTNKHGYIQMKNADSPYKLKVEEEGYILTVYPTYKKGKDIFSLSKGAVVERIIATESDSFKHSNFHNSNPKITGTKKLTKSLTKANKYNLEFTLSNGITFTYVDGKYNAKLNNKYLNIYGKYVIKSKLGILKISFNPRNGETWWVFEEKK